MIYIAPINFVKVFEYYFEKILPFYFGGWLRSIDMRMYTLDEVPKDGGFRQEEQFRNLVNHLIQ